MCASDLPFSPSASSTGKQVDVVPFFRQETNSIDSPQSPLCRTEEHTPLTEADRALRPSHKRYAEPRGCPPGLPCHLGARGTPLPPCCRVSSSSSSHEVDGARRFPLPGQLKEAHCGLGPGDKGRERCVLPTTHHEACVFPHTWAEPYGCFSAQPRSYPVTRFPWGSLASRAPGCGIPPRFPSRILAYTNHKTRAHMILTHRLIH